MKVTPVGAAQNITNETGPNLDKIARAKSIAAGEQPQVPQTQPTDLGDKQANRIRTLKMRTQTSPDRPIETAPPSPEPVATQNDISNNNEAQGNTEETRPLSPQYVALAKARRALQLKEQELAKREAEFKAPDYSEYVKKSDLVAAPLRTLLDNGVTYDRLTEDALANPANQDIASLKAEIKGLKDELTNQFNQRDLMAEQQVLSDMTRQANSMASTGNEYKFIREENYVPAIIDSIHEHYKETGELLDLAETMQKTEQHLIDKAVAFYNDERVRSKITPPQETQVVPSATTRPIMRTLTNRDNAQPMADRRSRAIAAFQGTLKR